MSLFKTSYGLNMPECSIFTIHVPIIDKIFLSYEAFIYHPFHIVACVTMKISAQNIILKSISFKFGLYVQLINDTSSKSIVYIYDIMLAFFLTPHYNIHLCLSFLYTCLTPTFTRPPPLTPFPISRS